MRGLTRLEAAQRLELVGPNRLPWERPPGLLRQILRASTEASTALLFASAGLYAVWGDLVDSLALGASGVVMVAIAVRQQWTSAHVLEALHEALVPKVRVLRDQIWQTVPAEDLVPGDWIRLSEGETLSADACLIEAAGCAVDESRLSGESFPVEKEAGDALRAGTHLVRGDGVAEVTLTGAQTEWGKLASAVLQRQRTLPTRLEKEVNQWVKRVTFAAFFLGASLSLLIHAHGTPWEIALLPGLTLSIALIPNEAPAITSLFLSKSAWRLSRLGVLVRRPAAVEALGDADTLCIDKTGTLTENRMRLAWLWNTQDELDLRALKTAPLPDSFHALLEFSALASRLESPDPLDQAVLQAFRSHLEGTDHHHPDWIRSEVRPPGPSFQAVACRWVSTPGNSPVGSIKGAPELVLDLCQAGPSLREASALALKKMTLQGLRVLAVARELSPGREKPEFLGLVGLEDPLREGVKEALAEFKAAGLRVLVITGDHADTAKALLRRINGEPTDWNAETPEKGDLLARATPEAKLQAVILLQKLGRQVVMTGDGVNDAPALRQAHVGVAMGKRGTDVARAAAQLVLMEDDLPALLHALGEGRRARANLSRAFGFLIETHIPIVFLTLLPPLWLWAPLLAPWHVAVLHLIIEPLAAFSFEALPLERLEFKRVALISRERLYLHLRVALLLSLSIGLACLAAHLLGGKIEALKLTALASLTVWSFWRPKQARKPKKKPPSQESDTKNAGDIVKKAK